MRLIADVDRSDDNHCRLTCANVATGFMATGQQPRRAFRPASSCHVVAATTLWALSIR